MDDLVTASVVSSYLNAEMQGEDVVIKSVSSLEKIEAGVLAFSKTAAFKMSVVGGVIICPQDTSFQSNQSTLIKVENPRLSFALVLNKFYVKKERSVIHGTVIIGNNCTIHPSVSIGAYTTVGDNVSIGEDTVINNNVNINANTSIGESCYIKSGSVIGEDGFGFDFTDDGTPIRVPHVGNVEIGDHVEIGAKCSIARSTLGSTVIEDFVKIDDQVHVAHNCRIGQKSLVAACVEFSGSVNVGEKCWIGPNSSMIQKIKIGDNVTIGIGAIVTDDVAPNKKMMGLESLDLRALVKLKNRLKFGE